jgi:hypothetical protein
MGLEAQVRRLYEKGEHMKTVIEMARESGLFTHKEVQPEIERFAELVRADEREACAKVCDDLALPPDVARSDASIWVVATLDCAEAIRARGSNT